jgi:hypothetical protein
MSENEETQSVKENKCVYSSFSLVDFFASLFSFSKKKEKSNPIIEEQKEDIFEPFVEKEEEEQEEPEEPVQEQEEEQFLEKELIEPILEKELIEPVLEKEEEKRDIEEVVKSIEDKIQSFQENYDLYIKNKSEEELLV